ncbi:MAG: glycosyl transferase, partial [Chloroflexales bacterium]|nr:glycosyl transferase [Chloroflexales bacterium]
RRADLLRATGQRDTARKAFAPPYTDPQVMLDWAWVNLRPAPAASFAVGDGLDFGYLQGFYPAERLQGRVARWSTGAAQLRLAGSATPQVLRLRAAAPWPNSSAAAVTVCSTGRCTRFALAPDWQTYAIFLPPTSAAERIVELRPDTFRADDGRTLGMMLDWVALR